MTNLQYTLVAAALLVVAVLLAPVLEARYDPYSHCYTGDPIHEASCIDLHNEYLSQLGR